MASLTENTSRIANAKESIKASLIKKGAEVLDSEKIENYSSKIDNLDVIVHGTYNVECYIRIDDVLIGEGVVFNVIGTDGSTQSATSRSAGFVYLSLEYGVGYDVQPADTEKYYANSHSLIYHKKEDGNYFATDYYFYTAGSGENFKITDLSYMFYCNSRIDQIDEYINNCGKVLNIKEVCSDITSYGPSAGHVDFTNFKKIIDNVDLSNCKSLSSAFENGKLTGYSSKTLDLNLPEATSLYSLMENLAVNIKSTLNININSPKATSIASMFEKVDNVNGTSQKGLILYVDFLGSTGNATGTSSIFRNSCTTGKIYCKNINLDKTTSTTYSFDTSGLYQLTFQGSFGGLSTTESLTLDLSQCTNLTLEAFLETMTTISENTNGNTRIFKLTSDLYNSLTDEIFNLADEKGYTLASA